MPRKDWIQSFSNKVVHPLTLATDEIELADIAAALSRKSRFSGQTIGTAEGYTVAQHCVIGSWDIAPPFALAFLLHEVSEVYLPDIPQPVKPALFVDMPCGPCTRIAAPAVAGPCQHTRDMIPWAELESRHADVIMQAMGLESLRPLLDCAEVKQMDLAMLATEKRDLMGPEPAPWGLIVEPLGRHIDHVWTATEARVQWLRRYHELRGNGIVLPAAPPETLADVHYSRP